jgi:hypothetical protein
MSVTAVDISAPAVPREAPASASAGHRADAWAGEERDEFATVLDDARAPREAAATPAEGRTRLDDRRAGRQEVSAPTGDRPGAARRAAARARNRNGAIDGQKEETGETSSKRAESGGVGSGRVESQAPSEKPRGHVHVDGEGVELSNQDGETRIPVAVEEAGRSEDVSFADVETIADTAAPATGKASDTAQSKTPVELAPPSGEASAAGGAPGQAGVLPVEGVRDALSEETSTETSPGAETSGASVPERGDVSEARPTRESTSASRDHIGNTEQEGDAPAAAPAPRVVPARERASSEAPERPREGAATAPTRGEEIRERGPIPAQATVASRGGSATEPGVAPATARATPPVERAAELDAVESDANGERAEGGGKDGGESGDVTAVLDEGPDIDVAGGDQRARSGSETGPGGPHGERSAQAGGSMPAARNGNTAHASGTTTPDGAPSSHGAQTHQGSDAARPGTAGAVLRAEQALAVDIERGAVARVRDGGEMRLALKPVGLGEVELRLAVRDGGVHAHLATAHEETRQLLAGHRHELETALQRYQLRLESFDIDLGGREGRSFLDRQPEPAVVSPGIDRVGSGPAGADSDETAVALRVESGRGTLSIRV